jgi:hypothetical protein
MYFWVGGEDKQNCKDMIVGIESFALADTNDPAEFWWDAIVNPVNNALLILGDVWDDYLGLDILIQLSGWDDTQIGPDNWESADINVFNGEWSYLFNFNDDEMPLGDFQLNISFVPKYDAVNDTYQNVTITDNTAPTVVGLVNVDAQYPCGVPNGTEYVPITVGANDDYSYWIDTPGFEGYYSVDKLSVSLFFWKDDDVALSIPMTHSFTGGTTFSANITLPFYATPETHNYTYFVEVWDPSNNKVTSVKYWFIHGTKAVCITPGFGILVGVFGIAAAVFIIYKRRK